MKWLLTISFFIWQEFAFASSPPGYVIEWGVNLSSEATGVSSSFIYTNHGIAGIANYYAAGVVPVAGQVLTNVTAISAGMSHSLALESDGTVAGFGFNVFGMAIGITNEYPHNASARVEVGGRILSNVVSVATGQYFSVALQADGTIIAWGENTVPAGLSNVVAISAHEYDCMALKNDGSVMGWASVPGRPRTDQLQEFPGLTDIVAIAAGGNGNVVWHTALRKNGTVVAWQHTPNEGVAVPNEMTNIVAIAAGSLDTLGLKSDGTVIGFGYNGDGQATGIPTHQRADDSHFSCGLVKIDGETLSNVVSVAASEDYGLALKSNGTVVAWGHRFPPIPEGLSNVVAIAAGSDFCLAITTNRAVAEKFQR